MFQIGLQHLLEGAFDGQLLQPWQIQHSACQLSIKWHKDWACRILEALNSRHPQLFCLYIGNDAQMCEALKVLGVVAGGHEKLQLRRIAMVERELTDCQVLQRPEIATFDIAKLELCQGCHASDRGNLLWLCESSR